MVLLETMYVTCVCVCVMPTSSLFLFSPFRRLLSALVIYLLVNYSENNSTLSLAVCILLLMKLRRKLLRKLLPLN